MFRFFCCRSLPIGKQPISVHGIFWKHIQRSLAFYLPGVLVPRNSTSTSLLKYAGWRSTEWLQQVSLLLAMRWSLTQLFLETSDLATKDPLLIPQRKKDRFAKTVNRQLSWNRREATTRCYSRGSQCRGWFRRAFNFDYFDSWCFKILIATRFPRVEEWYPCPCWSVCWLKRHYIYINEVIKRI